MVNFENFVKSMPPSLSELKVIPSFCFAFKIPDDVTATNKKRQWNYWQIFLCVRNEFINVQGNKKRLSNLTSQNIKVKKKQKCFLYKIAHVEDKPKRSQRVDYSAMANRSSQFISEWKNQIILAPGWGHFGRFLGFSDFYKGSPNILSHY